MLLKPTSISMNFINFRDNYVKVTMHYASNFADK